MKLKYLSLGLIAFFLSFLGLSCATLNSTPTSPIASPSTAQPLTQVKACYTSTSGNQVALGYAYEKGVFQKHGLDVKLFSIKSGTEAGVAMIAKNVDFCQTAGAATMNAVIAGEDLVMIAGLVNRYPYSLMVSPDIKTAEDLKGKAVAINKPGSGSDTAIRVAVKYLNLRPDQDLDINSIGEEGERLLAMEAGRIAGTLFSFPYSIKAQAKGYHTLLDMSKLEIPYQHTGITTTRSYIRANPEATTNFMKAIVEAIAMMKKDKEGAISILVKSGKYDLQADAALLDEWYDTVIQAELSKVPYPTLKGIEAMLATAQSSNPKASNFKAEDIVDISILQNLEKSGFINSLYQ